MADNIPVRLKRWRKKTGLTQEEAAHRIGTCLNTWANWERGTHAPSKLAIMLLVKNGVLERTKKEKGNTDGY